MRSKFYYIFLVAAMLAMQSCKKGYFDLNENPNQVTVPSLSSLLSTVTHKTGINNFNVAGITNNYVQYTANPSASSASDIYQQVDFSGTWDALYFALADISDLKKLAQEQNATEYQGVANVLLAYHINLVSDLWGSAPFSDAFNPNTLTPQYDSAEELYKTSNDLLDSAISQLAITTATIKLSATNDLIHKGVRTAWLKTAYALKARNLIKVSETASYNPAAVLMAVDNSYTSNADDAGMASFILRNPWAQVARSNASLTLGGWLSDQLINQLNGTTYGVFDPRIRQITDPTAVAATPWIGTENGAGNRPPGNNTVKDENYISISSPWTSDVAPIWIMTYAELKFIEAEAALATNPARAYSAYLAGINANMNKLQVGATDPERVVYMAAASVGAISLTRALIMKEKYIATYLNPEAWNDARRYDYMYKDFTLPANAVLPTFIRRLAYPSGERSKNGQNIPNVAALSDKLWWDQ